MNEMFNQFQQFMEIMKGKDPHAVINSILSSGQVNQQQLNFAQQKAKEFGQYFQQMNVRK